MQAGDVHLAGKRRTRLDGDSWQSGEVPLAEESEAYLVRVIQASSIVSEYTVTQPQFIYAAAMRAADGVSGVFQMAVAQISASFGPGPLRLLDVVA